MTSGARHDRDSICSGLEHLHEGLWGDHEVEVAAEARQRACVDTDRADAPGPGGPCPPRDLVEQLLFTLESPDVRAERPQRHAHASHPGAQLENRPRPKCRRGRPTSRPRAAQAGPEVEIRGVPAVLDLAPGDCFADGLDAPRLHCDTYCWPPSMS